VDGALYEMSPPPKHLAIPVVSRIKVMANLNISERRVPQDGALVFRWPANRSICVSPASDAIRRIGRVARAGSFLGNLELETLGFPKYVYDYVSEVILAQRHLRRHGTDRLRQNHHAVFVFAPRQYHRFKTPHCGRPGGI
jgi:hypothetical protein